MQDVINQNTVFMNTYLRNISLVLFFLLTISCSAPGGNENTTVLIRTTLGDIKILLYDGTPIHRDNFIKLVNSSFYDDISFHRVIKDFMIQAGDPRTKSFTGKDIPDSLYTYTIPAEFNRQYFHKKGALAAAREGNEVNPEMRSSGTQFYIVQGTRYTDEELDLSEQRINSNIKQTLFNRLMRETSDSIRLAGNPVSDGGIQEIASVKMFQYLTTHSDIHFTDEQRNVYKSTGGTPRLDGTYTVFGEVVEGLDVVDKIASVQTDSFDRPLTDIKITKIRIVNN